MSRAIDLFVTYRFLKLLVTPWKKQEAYKQGIIDDKGKLLKKSRDFNTEAERESFTLLHRFVFNLKRLLGLLPGGKSKFASYATALALLLKENKDINAVELERGLYKHLIENSLFSDCYFYIGYVNRNNFYRIKNSLDKFPEIIHILKTGFDLEYDSSAFETDIQSLHEVAQILLKSTHK